MNGERLLTPEEWDDVTETDHKGSPKGLKCPFGECPHVFDNEPELLTEHLERYHGVAPDGVQDVYRCWRCGVTSDHRSAIGEHVRDEHGDRLGERDDSAAEAETWEPWGSR